MEDTRESQARASSLKYSRDQQVLKKNISFVGSEVAYRSLARLIWLYRVPCFLLCLSATSPLPLSDITFVLLAATVLSPPDIVQSCFVIINLPVPESVNNHVGSLTVDLRDKSITMRVVVFWDSWRSSSVLSRVLSLLSRRRRNTWMAHARDRKQTVRSARGVKCYITMANGSWGRKETTYRTSEISRFKVRVPLLFPSPSVSLYQVTSLRHSLPLSGWFQVR